jgi:RNase H-fold protein (predicted Holliday junction resolvase)
MAFPKRFPPVIATKNRRLAGMKIRKKRRSVVDQNAANLVLELFRFEPRD